MSSIDSFSLSSHASHAGIDDFGQYSVNDILKVGYMKKLKTNKRKYFVLRLNHSSAADDLGGGFTGGGIDQATLSYYDNEKKFRANLSSSGQQPRRTIVVRECFAIDRKIDAKHRFVLAIYTKEDCLCTILEDEAQLNDWLDALRNILYHSIDYLHRQYRDFEHIWQVNISRTGLGLSRNITGLHRVCLSLNILYVIRVDPSTDSPDVYEFPLNSIRRCGHSQSTFFLELGRSSLIGPGEVWMQTDDQSLAQNMHEVILSSMTAGSATGLDDESGISNSHRTSSLSHRPRSSSASVNETKSSLNSVMSGRNSANVRHNSFKQQHSSALVQYDGAAGAAVSSHGHFVHYGPGQVSQCFHHHHGQQQQQQQQHHCHPCVVRNSSATVASNGSTQPSPSNSREHLHSGSWSRTASECSNEDIMGSQGAFSSASSNAVVLSTGSTNNNSSSSHFDHVCNNGVVTGGHPWSSSNVNCCCYSPSFAFGHSTCSADFSNANSSSSLSADCDSDLAQMNSSIEYHPSSSHGTGLLTHEPPISEEADGTGSDDYFPMNPTSIAAASTKLHHQQCLPTPTANTFHIVQHSMQHIFPSSTAHHHRHYHRSVSGTSPITSPKYGQCCCSCSHHFAMGNGYNRPSMMGTDDYLPMSPVGNNGNNSITNGTTHAAICSPNYENVSKHSISTAYDDEEDSGYLVMAPLSPASSTTSKNLCESINRSSNLMSTSPGAAGSMLHNEPQVNATVLTSMATSTVAQDDSIFSGLTRAYSTGSKPQPLAPSLGAQCIISVPSATNQLPTPTNVVSNMTDNNMNSGGSSMMRIRAFSTGSHGVLNPNVIRLNSRRLKKQLLQQQQQQQQQQQHAHHQPHTSVASFDGETILSSNSSLTEDSAAEMLESKLLSAKHSKASSAPILSPMVQPRARSATLGARPSINSTLVPSQTGPAVAGLGSGHWQPQFYGGHQSGAAMNTPNKQHSHLIYSMSGNHPNAASAASGLMKQPPTLSENDNDDEGDLMEIDYSDKAKHGSKSNILDENCDVILSNFEEELLREAKKLNQTERRRSRQNHAGGASSSDSVIAALQAAAAAASSSNQPLTSTASAVETPPGRKRSDSTSAIGTFFGPSRPAHHGSHGFHGTHHHSTHNHQHTINSHHILHHQHGHGSRHSTLDSFVASFKNTLNLSQNSASNLDNPSVSSSITTATPTTVEEDQHISTPNKTSVASEQHSKDSKSLLNRNRKNNHSKHSNNLAKLPAETEPEETEEECYTMMAPLSVASNSNSKTLNTVNNDSSKSSDSVSSTEPTPSTAASTSATTSDLQVKMALAQMKKVDLKSNDDDEDASPYVVMSPVEAASSSTGGGGGAISSSGSTSGNRKSHSSSSTSASNPMSTKKSIKSVRSLLFGPSQSSGSSATTSASTTTTNDSNSSTSSTTPTTRKKSSTFSGKLSRLGSRSGGNHEKRKTSKSESSDSLASGPATVSSVTPASSSNSLSINTSTTTATTATTTAASSCYSAISTVSTTITSPSLA